MIQMLVAIIMEQKPLYASVIPADQWHLFEMNILMDKVVNYIRDHFQHDKGARYHHNATTLRSQPKLQSNEPNSTRWAPLSAELTHLAILFILRPSYTASSEGQWESK